MLCCAVLCCAVLCCAVLCRAVPPHVQARVCRQLKASSRQECEGVAFCSYDRGSSRCLKRSLEFESDFDFKVKRLYG